MNSLQALWSRRDLVHVLAASDFKSRHRRFGLGVAWAAVTPLFQGAVIAVVFTAVGRFSEAIPFPYALYVLTGVMPWQFFSAAVVGGSRSVLDNGPIVLSRGMPRAALPTASVLANLYGLVFTLGALLLIVGVVRVDLLVQIYLLPVAVLLLLLLAYGIALALATLQVRFRDVDPLLQTAILAWFWVTPIIYPFNDPRLAAHPLIQDLIRVNPVTGVVGMFRSAFVGLPVDAWATISTVGWTVLLLVVGWRVFTRREATVADFL
jgi:ABC-type polysaccharide/polyol phosphate export permease